MAVRLRLTRMGRKKRPYYRIVAVDGRKRRDGAFIERLGYYHPLEDPPGISIDADKALKWLRTGAQPSDTVLSLLKKEGVWLRFRLEKRGLPEQQVNDMMAEWFAERAKAALVVEKPAAKEEPAPSEPDVEEPAVDESVVEAKDSVPPEDYVTTEQSEEPPAEAVKETPVEAEKAAEAAQETPVEAEKATEAAQETPVEADKSTAVSEEPPEQTDSSTKAAEETSAKDESQDTEPEKTEIADETPREEPVDPVDDSK